MDKSKALEYLLKVRYDMCGSGDCGGLAEADRKVKAVMQWIEGKHDRSGGDGVYKICGNCEYWERSNQAYTGVCAYYPPTVVATGKHRDRITQRYPGTDSDWFCAFFSPHS